MKTFPVLQTTRYTLPIAGMLLLGLTGCADRNPPPQASVFAPVEQAAPPAGISPVEEPVEPAAYRRRQPVVTSAQLPAGTVVTVQLDHALDTKRNRAGDPFTATLDAPLMIGGRVMLPKGTRFQGHLTAAKPSGRLKGRGVLAMRLDSFVLRGQTYKLETGAFSTASRNHKRRNATAIGGGSGAGALIGAIAGGGKGALIGAGVGAVAGTAGAFFTGKKDVRMPAESVLSFSLKAPVSLRG